jgi:hypothetical protein
MFFILVHSSSTRSTQYRILILIMIMMDKYQLPTPATNAETRHAYWPLVSIGALKSREPILGSLRDRYHRHFRSPIRFLMANGP